MQSAPSTLSPPGSSPCSLRQCCTLLSPFSSSSSSSTVTSPVIACPKAASCNSSDCSASSTPLSTPPTRCSCNASAPSLSTKIYSSPPLPPSSACSFPPSASCSGPSVPSATSCSLSPWTTSPPLLHPCPPHRSRCQTHPQSPPPTLCSSPTPTTP